MKASAIFATLALAASQVAAHYTWTALVTGGSVQADWQHVRKHNNMNSPVTNVSSGDFRCNVGAVAAPATANVAAGSSVGFKLDNTLYHIGVTNVYMAKVPSGKTAANFDGSGSVWFKVHQISATADGKAIKFQSDGLSQVTFTVPRSTPSGEYLLRIEHIALHAASGFGGAQFYISCGQINVTGGGSGNPGPKVAIPGVYNGNEPGIMINVYYPIPTSYVQPGPAVWSG